MAYYVVVRQVQRKDRSSRISKAFGWLSERVAGTWLEGILLKCSESVFAQWGVAITVGIVVGFIAESIPSSYAPLPFAITCTLVGGIIGLLAGGGAGIIPGLTWGWLLGAIIDSAAAKYAQDIFESWIGKVMSWTIGALVGWALSRLTANLYEEFVDRNEGLKKIVVALVVTTVVVSCAAVIYGTLAWTGLYIGEVAAMCVLAVKALLLLPMWIVLVPIVGYVALVVIGVIDPPHHDGYFRTWVPFNGWKPFWKHIISGGFLIGIGFYYTWLALIVTAVKLTVETFA